MFLFVDIHHTAMFLEYNSAQFAKTITNDIVVVGYCLVVERNNHEHSMEQMQLWVDIYHIKIKYSINHIIYYNTIFRMIWLLMMEECIVSQFMVPYHNNVLLHCLSR